MIEARGLGKRFPGVTALSGVDFSVAPGEVVARLGENGAGKSTLIKALGGLQNPDEGELLIDGKSVRTGCTTGISVFPHNGLDAASLLANPGAALFRAKAKSRGSISIYEPEMDQQIRDRRVLHQDLSLAIKNGELSQPFQTDAGWHVMQLENTRTTDKTNDLQRDQAKNMVFQRKAEDEYESFLRQIRSEAYVEIRLPGGNTPGPDMGERA